MNIRDKVINSFQLQTGAYSHITPYKTTHFIDGMAWMGILAAGCRRAGDTKLEGLCKKYLQKLCDFGPDVRNYSHEKISDKWEKLDDLYVLKKPQAFAGPAALYFAIESGVDIDPKKVKRPTLMADIFTSITPFIGLLKYDMFKVFRQHVNSIFFAHLLNGKKANKAFRYLTYDNPLYKTVISGSIESIAVWPSPRKSENGRTEKSDKKVELRFREPSPWPAKNWIYNAYVPDGTQVGDEYTPTCELASLYLNGLQPETL